MIHIKTPGQWLKDCGRKIPIAVKTAFFSAIVIGLMTHLYQFTNKLYNYDELFNTPGGYGIGAEAGRWFLKLMGDFMGAVFGNYSLPLVNGTLSILFLALSAALVTDMFEVSERFFAAAIGGLLVAFPAVVCLFFFMFTAVFYSVGIFFSILAAYLVIRFPRNIALHITAAVLLSCSLGTYQAYFANAVCLLLMNLILMSAFQKKKKTWKEIIVTGLRYLGVLVLALLSYLLLNKIFLAYWNLTMVNYQGLDSMGSVSLGELVHAVQRCYEDVFGLFSRKVMGLNPTHLLRKCFLAIFLLYGISAIFVFVLDKGDWIKKGFMILGFLLFPVGLFLVYVMSPNGWAYALMGYSVVFLPVFLVVWVEQFCSNICGKNVLKAVGQWITLLLITIILAVYIWYGNGCYMALEYTKYHDLAYYETMITQVKSLDGYTDDMPVAFIGNTIEDKTHSLGSMMGEVFGMDGKSESNINAYSYQHIITKYLGFAPVFSAYEEIRELMERDEIKEMNCYPDSGSMKIVDGTVVIKLSE